MPAKYCPKCRQGYAATQRFCPVDQEVLSLQDPYHLVGRTLLDKYRIEALVGLGGMGAVYCAHHLGIDRRVAFKILQPNIALGNEYVVALFEREAKLAGRLTHENIVDVKDAGHTPDGIAYIVMEWLAGHTLDEELNEHGRLSFVRALGIARQIAAALAAAHAKHVIHRDLKPGNIMLVDAPAGRDHVKVVDFGIGKIVEGKTGDSPVSAVLGTPHYASPEQLTVGGQIDGRSDIYSLGIILYHMLGGQVPFHSASLGELIQMQLTVTPALLSRLRPETPPALSALVDRMLAKEPAQRPQSARAFIELLDQAAAQLGDVKTVTDELAVTGRGEEPTVSRKRDLADQPTEELPAQISAEAPTRVATATRPNGRAKPYLLYATIIGAMLVAGGYGLYRYSSASGLHPNNGRDEVTLAGSPTLPLPLPTPTADDIQPAPTTQATGPSAARLSPTPARTTPSQNQQLVAEHLKQARALYQQGQYQDALRECNEALRLNPQQAEARQLKQRINRVIRILNGR